MTLKFAEYPNLDGIIILLRLIRAITYIPLPIYPARKISCKEKNAFGNAWKAFRAMPGSWRLNITTLETEHYPSIYSGNLQPMSVTNGAPVQIPHNSYVLMRIRQIIFWRFRINANHYFLLMLPERIAGMNNGKRPWR